MPPDQWFPSCPSRIPLSLLGAGLVVAAGGQAGGEEVVLADDGGRGDRLVVPGDESEVDPAVGLAGEHDALGRILRSSEGDQATAWVADLLGLTGLRGAVGADEEDVD